MAPRVGDLDGRFTIAQALDDGYVREQLRAGGRLRAPHHGSRSTVPPRDPVDAALDLAAVLRPPWAFSHTTAARLLGIPLPWPWVPGEILHVCRPTDRAPVRRPRVRGHRGLERRDIVNGAQGLPVVGPEHTWFDLAAMLGHDDLVVAGDHLVGRDGPSTIPLLERAFLPSASHLRVARTALADVRIGSQSPQETRSRLAIVHHGLPEPELNVDVIGRDGTWLARCDLVYREQRVAVEYDGRGHMERRSDWQRDVDRYERLRADGWIVVTLLAHHLAGEGAAAAGLVRAALERSGIPW